MSLDKVEPESRRSKLKLKLNQGKICPGTSQFNGGTSHLVSKRWDGRTPPPGNAGTPAARRRRRPPARPSAGGRQWPEPPDLTPGWAWPFGATKRHPQTTVTVSGDCQCSSHMITVAPPSDMAGGHVSSRLLTSPT